MFEPNRMQQALGTSPLRQRAIEVLVGGTLLILLTAMVVSLSPLYVIGALVGLVASLYFFARPEIGLLGYFGFRMIADLLWWLPLNLGGLSILEALSGGFTALAAVLFYVELRRVEHHPAFGALLTYVIVLSLSAVRSGELRAALEIMAKYMSPFLILFLVTDYFRRPEGWRKVMGLFALVGLVPVSLSVYHLLTGQMSQVALAGLNRLLGGYENLHNHGHMMLMLAIVYTFWAFYLPRGWLRWAAFGLAGAAALCLYFSYVRTPLLGLAVFAIVFPIMERRWTLLGLVVTAGAVLVLSSETMRQRFIDLLLLLDVGDVTLDRSRLGSGRVGIWQSSVEEFLKLPVLDIVLGAGLGGHWAMVQSYVDQYRSSRGGTLSPHNDYLSLLYQLGPVAVICYVTLQISMLYHAIRLRSLTEDRFVRTFASFATGLGTLVFVTNFVSASFLERVTPAMMLWTMAGLVYAMHAWALRERAARLAAQRASGPTISSTSEAASP